MHGQSDQSDAGRSDQYCFGDFTLDRDRGFLLLRGQEVRLRPKVFELLTVLVANHGRLVSKDDLISAVWPDAAVTDNSLAQCLFELRRALEDDQQIMIRTVARRGYVFDAPVWTPARERPAEPTDTAPTRDTDEGGREPASTPAGSPPPPRVRSRTWPVPVGLALVLFCGGTAFMVTRGSESGPGTRAPRQLTNFNDSAVSPSVSHDGRLLTFVRGGSFGTAANPKGQIYVKALPDGQAIQLTDDDAHKDHPVFSPDDSRIIYTALLPGLNWDSWQVPVLRGTPHPFLKNASGVAWLDGRRIVYSTIMAGAHMGIAASTESRSDYSEIYFPAREDGMAHRTSPSPDGRSLLVVEMTGGTWTPCRLIPTDGASSGRRVGPADGQCTSAAWSPDGRWMYFSSNAGGAFHVWRQRYPDGKPEQITFGPTEQEGTAITPDGRTLITSMGLQQASLWWHDAHGDRKLTDEAYVSQPTIDPASNRMYYIVRTSESEGQASGELWRVDLLSGERQPALPGIVLSNYALSTDGAKVVFSSFGRGAEEGIWITSLDRQHPPRRLVAGRDLRGFFGADGEVIYSGADGRIHRIGIDGANDHVVSDVRVTYLSTVSPDGRWAVVIRPAEEGDGNTNLAFVSLRDERSFPVCNADCLVGPRSFLAAPPFVWSLDGQRLFVNLMHFGKNTPRSVSLPYRPDASIEALWPNGLKTEADVTSTPGATLIRAPATFPGATADTYVAWRASTLSNLYEIDLPDAP